MTIYEASNLYSIPLDILREYESWGLRGTTDKIIGDWQYDDADLERLSTIMTLHDLGFTSAEIEAYMRLKLAGGCGAEQLRMLDRRRSEALDEIHSREKQVERLDYLRHELRKNCCG